MTCCQQTGPVANLAKADAAVQEMDECMHEDIQRIECYRREADGIFVYLSCFSMLWVPFLYQTLEVPVTCRIVNPQDDTMVFYMNAMK